MAENNVRVLRINRIAANLLMLGMAKIKSFRVLRMNGISALPVLGNISVLNNKVNRVNKVFKNFFVTMNEFSI